MSKRPRPELLHVHFGDHRPLCDHGTVLSEKAHEVTCPSCLKKIDKILERNNLKRAAA